MRFSRTYFNDFIYAITIGSGLGEIAEFSLNKAFICCSVLFVLALEDFYSYKRWIDVDRALDKYGMPSLFVEFAILVAWFGALKHAAANEPRDTLLWLGAFWIIKFIAGFAYYIRQPGREGGVLPDTVWFFGSFTAFLITFEANDFQFSEATYWWICVSLALLVTCLFQIARRVLDTHELKQDQLKLTS